MQRARPPRPPLDRASLERLALRYVERFSTTRGRLIAYLARKIVERGWAEEAAADPRAIAERFAELGYVDHRAFAAARSQAMTRRGLGARRVGEALRHAGVDEADRAELGEALAGAAMASALTFARRKRIGPYAVESADRALRERQVAAMVRAGHAPRDAWRIVRMTPDEATEILAEFD